MSPVDALQRTLAGEHAAVYVYGVLGGRVSDSEHPDLAGRLAAAYTTHRARREQLTALVRAAGADPVAAEVSYQLPDAATSATQLATTARVLEQRCAEVYAQAVGSTSLSTRRWAIGALLDAALRGLGFGAAPTAFPGVGEL